MRFLPRISAIAILAGSLTAALGDPPNGIRAVVHDAVITHDEVEVEIEPDAQRLSQTYRGRPELFQAKLNELRSAKLESLMDRQLILHEFKVGGFMLPESVVDELVQEQIHAQFGDRVTATKSMQAQGITYEKFRQKMRDRFVITALRQKNISSEIIISPHKVETYYLAHKEDYKMEDEAKLRMIVIDKSKPRKLAEEIVAKLNQNVSFEEMAKEAESLSKETTSDRAQRSGGSQWYQTARLRKELSEVVSKLKAGQHSEVIDTPDSYYIVNVEETHPEHIKPLTEVRSDIERDLLSQERARLEKQWMERLKKKTFVQIFP